MIRLHAMCPTGIYSFRRLNLIFNDYNVQSVYDSQYLGVCSIRTTKSLLIQSFFFYYCYVGVYTYLHVQYLYLKYYRHIIEYCIQVCSHFHSFIHASHHYSELYGRICSSFFCTIFFCLIWIFDYVTITLFPNQ